MHMVHSPLNPTISSASVLQITAVHAESLVWDGLDEGGSKAGWCFKKKSSKIVNNFHAFFSRKLTNVTVINASVRSVIFSVLYLCEWLISFDRN